MSDLGKIDRPFFERHVAPNLGADRTDVAVGPRHGVDFGVLDIGGQALVTATDPLSILPALGFERAGRFALDLVLADVAVSGIAPSHLSICFTLPETMTDEQFATVWEAIHAECADLGVAVVTGHTARYSDPSHPWVGAATAMGVGDHADIVRPDGASVGDRLLLTTGPAVESVGLLSTLFGDQLELPDGVVADAQDRLEEVYCVRDALAAAAAGPVTAMHDVTEGGLAGALNEMADGAGVRFAVDRAAVPMRPGVREVCEALEIDPWAATSSGSLLIAVDPAGVDAVREALEDRDTVVADIGRVEAESGEKGEGEVVVDGERLEHPSVDPSWAAYAELADAASD
ncbi:HypE family hydrogenase expression/formation protein [Natronorubrum texcoconense]|uniref:Hydrogenase maturation factor n=1 Tax=Natronorubrum texcoconense TaxID=1095776 RepID=A0A1G8TIY8_9EURY|nr:AIR synthase family protein [Natronorubrum texcoconense]SDJ41357.1 Hydrogenase maturation factor [Natronorubrum texcoconense]